MKGQYTEQVFEAAIEGHLITQAGYQQADPRAFDRERCLDPAIFLAFVQETQPKEWEYLKGIQKEKAEGTLLDSLCQSLNSDHEGCLSVLRHGFKCFGKLFRAAFFKPASGMNPDTVARYEANRLTVTRQLHYSPKHENSLDVVLSLNGIPVATAELKNPFTGQTWRNAVHQYKSDRDPNDLIFQFKKRALVHFAVDPDQVYMATRLAWGKTFFLPFNKGNGNGAGNPPNQDGYKTAYLWESIWEKDSFLDILARFIHLEVVTKKIGGKKFKKETMIFPRYHQLDSVRKLVVDAREKRTGHNYLVQHSAGSGKSNSIAWLAHRLASLHDANDDKVFDSVIVVTDRRVLDQQLQDTVYQFEHKQGVVQKIEEDSAQLAQAIITGVPIIITTMQKFPFVTEKVGDIPSRKYAVIIDEAHSSQGGETATDMKGALAGKTIKEEAKKQAEEEGLPDYEEEILRSMAKRGQQPNISFFAFTATPKYKTMEVFGIKGADGKPQPFHLYSMRQAIEEGFILDVLEHYITYKSYYRLAKMIEDDPEVDKSKAASALTRFMSLHPHNIAQKTQVMVEHFRNSTMHKIGGKAKAMVVTSSRLHAVRYKLAFDEYIQKMGYQDIKSLVAFSGTVKDPDTGAEYTEVSMNKGIKEKELPERFSSPDFQVLLVAEKYQTGFDQPLLHTMYVDKRLKGVHAVQTLSRLNRTHAGKKDTFVLDFVNEPQDIQEAFQPYYERTLVEEQVEPRQLYELQAKLDAKQIYFKAEVEEFAKVFFKPKAKQTRTDQAKLYALVGPAVQRYEELSEENREAFRKDLISYRNLYAFISQIIPFWDADLEKLYSFVRFLITKLPKREFGPSYHFDDEVSLQYYRLEKISEGAIALEKKGGEEVAGAPTAVGTGNVTDKIIELSQLIDLLNERFGTDFKPADQLFFDSIMEDAVADNNLRQVAIANTMENFGYVFLKQLNELFLERMDQNEEMTAKFLNEKAFRSVVGKAMLKQVYEQIRADQANGA